MGFLQKVISIFSREQRTISITFLGPSKSGKTTLIRFLETGKPVEEELMSTLGLDYRSKPISYGNVSMGVIDVGGQQIYQNAFWEFSVEQSDGVVYLIDSTIHPETDPFKFETQIKQFEYLLNILPEDTVVMIMLNKQDIVEKNPIDVKRFMELYPVKNLAGRTFTVQMSSAKYGSGVEEAFNWFVAAVAKQGV